MRKAASTLFIGAAIMYAVFFVMTLRAFGQLQEQPGGPFTRPTIERTSQ